MKTSVKAGAGTATATRPWEAIALERPLPIDSVPTPALAVDAAALERNLERMAAHAKAKDIALRPHTKTHKCPLLAKKQLELGAIGVCAAKVSEAEVMVDAGIEAVLITSPVVTRDKISRVVELARRSRGAQIVVDNAAAATSLGDAARSAGVTVGVLIDLDPGMGRTGVAPGAPALDLLRHIARLPGLRFDGLQCYAGNVMHVNGWEERRKRSLQALERAIETKALMEREGFEVRAFTGGGTGTFDIDCDVDAFTDLQVGSYLFMDVGYRRCGGRGGAVFNDFEPSLFVLATAISKPAAGYITIDAGFKSLSADSGVPDLYDVSGVVYKWGGDEHGILVLESPSRPIELGDQVTLIVPHCDPTVNLYDVFHPYRNGRVEELWPISARGKSQ
ncbi:MAG TPA: DSD1 family PLP-dependent enzyme [Thermoanaerobaculia bacterium]|nr:DSD1 family PLP-dependent enzyme [Thermoanaerobaculia bacterium]